jgi:GTPase
VRSGFATFVGRPNVGKSTLLNAILGTKVSIVSDKAQTTRTQVRGVLTRPDAQVVFVDTPGIHKPRTLLGERLNHTATSAVGDVDVVLFVIDATAPLGKGDRWVASRVPPESLCVINKVDAAARRSTLDQLTAAGQLEFAEYFPVSAVTGEGLDALVSAVVDRLPEGPPLYPDDMVTDVPEAFWVAELVREQLLAVTRDEVPHSIACRVTEWEWPRVRCEILVERDSQKGIVIGRGGSVLKEVGTRVRGQLSEGVFLELFVKVDKDWQDRPKALERLGYRAVPRLRTERGEEVLHVSPVPGAAHGRQGVDEVPVVAGRGEPRVEHRHHAPVG